MFSPATTMAWPFEHAASMAHLRRMRDYHLRRMRDPQQPPPTQTTMLLTDDEREIVADRLKITQEWLPSDLRQLLAPTGDVGDDDAARQIALLVMTSELAANVAAKVVVPHLAGCSSPVSACLHVFVAFRNTARILDRIRYIFRDWTRLCCWVDALPLDDPRDPRDQHEQEQEQEEEEDARARWTAGAAELRSASAKVRAAIPAAECCTVVDAFVAILRICCRAELGGAVLAAVEAIRTTCVRHRFVAHRHALLLPGDAAAGTALLLPSGGAAVVVAPHRREVARRLWADAIHALATGTSDTPNMLVPRVYRRVRFLDPESAADTDDPADPDDSDDLVISLTRPPTTTCAASIWMRGPPPTTCRARINVRVRGGAAPPP